MPSSAVFRAFRGLARLFSGHGLRDRYPGIDHAYRLLNSRLAPRTAVVRGRTMFLDPGDSMGLSVHGIYEPAETALVAQLVRPGAVAVDIGANIGYYTLLMSDLAGPAGFVLAVEPDPATFKLLQKNIATNRCANVATVQAAIADRNSRATLYRDRFGNLDHRLSAPDGECVTAEVEVARLDDLLASHSRRTVDFVKMDIQGSEGLALEGMTETLMRSPSVMLLTEFWPAGLDMSGSGAAAFLTSLRDMGFSLFDVAHPDGLEAEARREDLLERYGGGGADHTNLLCRRATRG